MEQKGKTPISFVDAAFGVPPSCAYVTEGEQLGQAVLWEWRYFHYSQHSTGLQSWLQRGGTALLAKLQEAYELPESSAHRPRRGQREGLCPRLTVSTAQATALLLHACHIASNAPERRIKCIAAAKEWLRMSAAGFPGTHEDLVIKVPLLDKDLALRIAPANLLIQNMHVLFEESPWLAKWWRNAGVSVLGLQSQHQLPHVSDAMLVLSGMSAAHRAKCDWLKPVLSGLLQVVAFGIERYITFVYLPRNGRVQPLPRLQGPLGKSRDIDPVNREIMGAKLDTIGGSGNTVAKAISGSGWHSQAWRHAAIKMHHERCQDIFKGARRISIACDPGGYSGEQTNIGVIYDHESGRSAILPAKVVLLQKQKF